MAINLNILSIPLNGTGTEIPTLNVTDAYEKYVLTGSTIATGNYALVPTGTPIQGTTFIFKYKASVDITTNGTTFSIFGQALTQNQLNSDLDIEAYYDNSAWVVEIKPSFTSAVVEASNLAPNAVSSASIANGSITEPKLATNSVTTNKIANLNVTTTKVADLGITDAKINDVNGSKVVDGTITNAKLATMTAASLKFGNNLGVVGDLVLANNEIPIGNGTTITKIDVSDLQTGTLRMATIPINFNTASSRYRIYFPVLALKTIHINTISLFVSETIAATDNGEIDVVTSTGAITNFTNIVVAANTTPTNELSPGSPSDNFDLPASFGAYIDFITVKPTPGGQVIANVFYEIQ